MTTSRSYVYVEAEHHQKRRSGELKESAHRYHQEHWFNVYQNG